MDARTGRGSQPLSVAENLLPYRDAVGFNFTAHMERLCRDMVRRVDSLRHINMDRVAVSYSRSRKRVAYGLHAALTPMRFENGATTQFTRGRQVRVQRLLNPDGNEMLYILSFYLPRFMDVDFDEKLVTIFHELWHINPAFNGDLRRHPGRCYAHSQSQQAYDREMAKLSKRWLRLKPAEELYDFLRYGFDELHARHGGVFGVRIPQPKLIPA